MNEITIAITYRQNNDLGCFSQIVDARDKYLEEKMDIREITWEKEWIPGKSRVTFKGVEL